MRPHNQTAPAHQSPIWRPACHATMSFAAASTVLIAYRPQPCLAEPSIDGPPNRHGDSEHEESSPRWAATFGCRGVHSLWSCNETSRSSADSDHIRHPTRASAYSTASSARSRLRHSLHKSPQHENGPTSLTPHFAQPFTSISASPPD